jgi:AraC-like DNA-binding protein
MRSLYIRPGLCAVNWVAPRTVAVSQLLIELVGFLDGDVPDAGRRSRAEALLVDLLEPVETATIEVRMPKEERAREVALALSENPADKRTLQEWGREVGASGRTLARSFLADTGIPFGRWRTLMRLQAALPALAAGEAVSRIAVALGYESASAFIAAFRRETGMTPSAFVKNPGSGNSLGAIDVTR